MRKTSRIEIRITEEKKLALSKLAENNNTTISKLLNDLIDLVLDGEKND